MAEYQSQGFHKHIVDHKKEEDCCFDQWHYQLPFIRCCSVISLSLSASRLRFYQVLFALPSIKDWKNKVVRFNLTTAIKTMLEKKMRSWDHPPALSTSDSSSFISWTQFAIKSPLNLNLINIFSQSVATMTSTYMSLNWLDFPSTFSVDVHSKWKLMFVQDGVLNTTSDLKLLKNKKKIKKTENVRTAQHRNSSQKSNEMDKTIFARNPLPPLETNNSLHCRLWLSDQCIYKRPCESSSVIFAKSLSPKKEWGLCAHYVMVSKFQWKSFWLATQPGLQNELGGKIVWTMTYSHRPHCLFHWASTNFRDDP